ncbi:MAG: pyridoxamine 5'-phosphate oxidase family protein [Clostridia bacterium]|nr:pyridoxamine 5'-phosphate oxidase family protein [Clostridia bacterium]
MRRKDRQMPKEWALEIVDKCEWATLATIDTDGKPYCIPLSIARIENVIYFHCAKEGKKIDCFNRNNQVCISCVGATLRPEDEFTTKFESAMVFGKISQVLEDSEKIEALRAICQRHTPANMPNFDEAIARSLAITAIWKVTIEDIDGKRRK